MVERDWDVSIKCLEFLALACRAKVFLRIAAGLSETGGEGDCKRGIEAGGECEGDTGIGDDCGLANKKRTGVFLMRVD
jgi:hypothetical protein